MFRFFLENKLIILHQSGFKSGDLTSIKCYKLPKRLELDESSNLSLKRYIYMYI